MKNILATLVCPTGIDMKFCSVMTDEKFNHLDDIYYGIKEYSHSINTNSSIVVPIQMKELEEALGYATAELVEYMQQGYSLDGYILKVGVV